MAGLAIGDAPAPFGALAFVALLRLLTRITDAGVGPVAAIDHRLSAVVEVDCPQTIGAVRGVFGLRQRR